MADYIVTVDVPVYVRVENMPEDMAADVAEDWWREQEVARKLEDALELTDWFVGDPYEDWDVSRDES